MDKAQREQHVADTFFTPGDILSLQAGQSNKIIPLTDVDEFPPVIAHRTDTGKVYCPTTIDAMNRNPEPTQKCALCDRGVPRMALAAVSIWNLTHKLRQIALLSGPKKGSLHSLIMIFNALGTYKTVIDMSREGTGQQTIYPMVPVATIPAVVPEGVVPYTKEEIRKMAESMLKERKDKAEW